MLEWSASNVRVAVVVGSAFTSDADASRAPDFVRHRPVLALDLRAPLAYRSSVVGSIRKAAEHQPVHRLATDLAGVRLVWEVYAEGARRNGLTPHPLALFESIHAHLGAQARFAWAEVGGAAAAAVVLLQTATTVDYYVAGTTERGRETQAGSWLADVEIRAAVARGGRIWNWMASPNQAVADYKKRWGAEEHTYSVRGWTFGDLGDWRGAAPGVLAAEFPGYFVVPYASPVVI